MNTARFRGKGIKVVAFLFVVSLLAFSGSLMAKSGAEIVVFKIDGNWVKGELIAVKQHSLLLVEEQNYKDISIDIRSVEHIDVLGGKSRVGKGALIGFVVGGLITGVSAASESNSGGKWFGGVGWALIGVATIGGLGALVGAIVGGISGRGNKRMQISGKNDEEISTILEDLRSKARMPDAQ
jgi:hypothetical protein